MRRNAPKAIPVNPTKRILHCLPDEPRRSLPSREPAAADEFINPQTPMPSSDKALQCRTRLGIDDTVHLHVARDELLLPKAHAFRTGL